MEYAQREDREGRYGRAGEGHGLDRSASPIYGRRPMRDSPDYGRAPSPMYARRPERRSLTILGAQVLFMQDILRSAVMIMEGMPVLFMLNAHEDIVQIMAEFQALLMDGPAGMYRIHVYLYGLL